MRKNLDRYRGVYMSTYIKFENVSKSFRHEEILRCIHLELEKGKIYGFVGRNGSGKTMIFKMLTGLMRPSSGYIFIEQVNMTKTRQFPQSVGALIEIPGFISHYSGLKNLKILNSLSNQRSSLEELKESMRQVGLDPNNKKPVRTYSLGMKQKLGIAQAIMNHPQLLILDEPMNGLDEESVRNMRCFFKKLKEEQGVTILLASHNQEDIEVLCDELFYITDRSVQVQKQIGVNV